MKVTICIGTFGHTAWLGSGDALAKRTRATFIDAEVIHKHGRTLAAARNECAWDASGDWLVFLDADDSLDAGYLAALARTWDYYGGAQRMLLYPAVAYDDAEPVLLAPKPGGIRAGNWMVIGTAIHYDVFMNSGGFHEEPAWEDWSLWQRAMGLGAQPIAVSDAIYRAKVNPRGRNSGIHRPTRLFNDILRANDLWLASQRKDLT